MSKTGFSEKEDGDVRQGMSTSPSLENEKEEAIVSAQDVEDGITSGKAKASVQGRIGR